MMQRDQPHYLYKMAATAQDHAGTTLDNHVRLMPGHSQGDLSPATQMHTNKGSIKLQFTDGLLNFYWYSLELLATKSSHVCRA